MIWPFKSMNMGRELINASKKHPSIRDYTIDELYAELERAERLDAVILSNICAEILRRNKGSTSA